MSTFYQSPAVIGTKQFYQDLLDSGVDNIEVQPVEISGVVKDITHDNYLLLNIIGRVSCADMDKSEYTDIGKGMNTVNKLVIDGAKTNGLLLFLLHEDTDCIVIHEQVYKHLQLKAIPTFTLKSWSRYSFRSHVATTNQMLNIKLVVCVSK
jgi:hypothetical protein